MNISVISGGFDPLHSGHIEYINSAKKIGEKLIVALNSDEWLIQKKGKFFLPFSERKIIVRISGKKEGKNSEKIGKNRRFRNKVLETLPS